jgi:hypothetical protein
LVLTKTNNRQKFWTFWNVNGFTCQIAYVLNKSLLKQFSSNIKHSGINYRYGTE